jgi:hypothetical protein
VDSFSRNQLGTYLGSMGSLGDIGSFGKGYMAPPPEAPPEDLAPTISVEEEQAILAATLPMPEPEPSFIRRNAVPLFVGGGVLVLGVVGMIFMIRI